ncbi:MAG: class I SAM-dependent methyltransferase [Anaerolineae bacterium]|nr:class I SAM-dependent methyltransferase [Anaerolineae bacterium]
MNLRQYRLLRPLDALCRRINGQADRPPIDLRRYVGPLPGFERTGGEFLAYLKLLAGLRADSRVLDIGCGCGLMALPLTDCLGARGRYVGMDISRAAIDWCQKEIAARHPHFSFIHSDIYNPRYNPAGRQRADAYVFPLEDGAFDLILLKSVLTHMRPPETAHYLAEIARLLGDGGCCLATFFLLNQAQRRLADEGRCAFDFRFGDETWRTIDADNPEVAVAYDEPRLLAMIEAAGLALRDTAHYGAWSGRDDGLSFQDILLLERAS